MHKLKCRNASSPDNLISLLLFVNSIPSLKSWTLDHLTMDRYINNPWEHLAIATGQGNIQRLTLRSIFGFVNNWVMEEVKAVKIYIAILHLDGTVNCETTEDVETLCAALALSQRWKINQLNLPKTMNRKGWAAMRDVISKGKVVKLNVSPVALSQVIDVLDTQQVETLMARNKCCKFF